jgi:diaminopimelate decarboxylase
MTPRSNVVRKLKAPVQTDPVQYTPFFSYRSAAAGGKSSASEDLHCEGVSLDEIARAVGTPAYVYSSAGIEQAYSRLDRAFGKFPHSLCYALKANANLSVLRILARMGGSFDIVSGGELDRLRRLGIAGRRIVFSGVGKTRDEIREAIRYPGKGPHRGILLFNVESGAELDVLLSEASRRGKTSAERTSAALRVNPDVLAGGHPHISTGHHRHKFGMDWHEARRLYLAHRDSRWIAWRGVSAHIGSQILSAVPYRRALTRLASYVRELGRSGIRLDYLDIGGGLGIRYTNEKVLDPAAYARTLLSVVKPLGCHLLLEPGRTLVGPAGVLLTRVLYVKKNGGKTFVVVDAAMNDLIRPVLYNATHQITIANRAAAKPSEKMLVDVVGPVCESGDFLARDWPLEPVKPGDLLVVWAAGAYASVQSSNYNARPRPAEVLIEGAQFRVVRRRQSRSDLVRGELARD